MFQVVLKICNYVERFRMKDKNYIETTNYTPEQLKQELGNVAILEGAMCVDEHYSLFKLSKIVNVKTTLLNIYREYEQFKELPINKIDTILVETSLSYGDKVYDVAEVLIKLYEKTGWKPKRVVNTMEYGLCGLYTICKKLDIEVFRIRESLDDVSEIDDWELQKVHFSETDIDDINDIMNNKFYEDLHENKSQQNMQILYL